MHGEGDALSNRGYLVLGKKRPSDPETAAPLCDFYIRPDQDLLRDVPRCQAISADPKLQS